MKLYRTVESKDTNDLESLIEQCTKELAKDGPLKQKVILKNDGGAFYKSFCSIYKDEGGSITIDYVDKV